MKFIDMFGGIGGFSLALRRCGHECVGYYEIDKNCVSVYNRNFGTSHEATDITRLDARGIPDFDILCGGFPCQAFSIAGNRGGFSDTRGTLFFEIARIAAERKPKLLLLENVAGLLSHDDGRTFATILHTLAELGYWWEYQVLNSRDFGVPQNRERVFIVGHLGAGAGRQVFPLGESHGQAALAGGEERQVALCIDGNYWKGPDNHQQRTMILSHTRDGKGNVTGYNERDEAGTLKQPSGNQQNFVIQPANRSIYDTNGSRPEIGQAHRVYGADGIVPPLQRFPIAISHSPRCGNPKKGGTGLLMSDEKVSAVDGSPHYVVECAERADRIIHVGNYQKSGYNESGQIVSPNGLCPTVRGQRTDAVPKIAIQSVVDVFNLANSNMRGPRNMPDRSFCLDGTGSAGIVILPDGNKQGYSEAAEGDGIRLERPDRTTGRGRVTKGTSPAIQTSGQFGVVQFAAIRRLTPKECERLQSFPELESFINIQIHNNTICLDLQNSYVNAEIRNHKLPRYVGNVGDIESEENVSFAKQNLNPNTQQTNRPVQEIVRINCVGEKIEVFNQEKSYPFASYVENHDSYLQYIKEEDFAQILVGINIILAQITRDGKGGLHQNEQYSIHQNNGELSVSLYGKEMTQLAKDVKNDSTILKKHLRSITSNHSSSKSIDSNSIISFFYAVSAIYGFIQKEIQMRDSLNLELYLRHGWTEFGQDGKKMSDTQRYKMCGNAVTVNVVYAIARRL